MRKYNTSEGVQQKYINACQLHRYTGDLWPLLLTWFNFNPSMDK